MLEDIELATHKFYFSTHDRVVTDANHENMSFFIVLEEAMRLAFLALCLRCDDGFREDALFLLRETPPRNFLIIFCVVSVTFFDKMSPVCPQLAAISVMTFVPLRKASRPTDLALLHSIRRTSSIALGENCLYHVHAVRIVGRNRWDRCQSDRGHHLHLLLDVYNTALTASYL